MLTQQQYIEKMGLTNEQMKELGLIVKPCNGFHSDITKMLCDGWQIELSNTEAIIGRATV